jgi:hypothetical protein
VAPDSTAATDLLAKCDRICGVDARYHKDRCPLYEANCAAMSTFGTSDPGTQPSTVERGTTRFRGRATIEFEVEARDYDHAVSIVSEPNFDPTRFNWWAALPDSVEVALGADT